MKRSAVAATNRVALRNGRSTFAVLSSTTSAMRHSVSLQSCGTAQTPSVSFALSSASSIHGVRWMRSMATASPLRSQVKSPRTTNVNRRYRSQDNAHGGGAGHYFALSPAATELIKAVLEQSLGIRSDREVLMEAVTMNASPAKHMALVKAMQTEMLAIVDSVQQLSLLSSSPSSQSQPAVASSSAASCLFLEVDEARLSRGFVEASVDAILSAPSLDALKSVLRTIQKPSNTFNAVPSSDATATTSSAKLVAETVVRFRQEHYIASLIAIANLDRGAIGEGGSRHQTHRNEAATLAFSLIANACRNNEDTLAVWESFFSVMVAQRQSAICVDQWVQKYRERMKDKYEAVRSKQVAEDLFGDAVEDDTATFDTLSARAGNTQSAAKSTMTSINDEMDLESALFPEFEEVEVSKPRASEVTTAETTPQSAEKVEKNAKSLLNFVAVPSALREPIPAPLDDGTIALPASIAKLLIVGHTMNRDFLGGLDVLNQSMRARHEVKERNRLCSPAQRQPFAAVEESCAISLAELAGGSPSSPLSDPSKDPKESFAFPADSVLSVSPRDHIEMLITLCYANRFRSDASDGGFKRNALATITGRTDGSIGPLSSFDGDSDAEAAEQSRRTAGLLKMPWNRIVLLIPALTIESTLTLVQLKAAYCEGVAKINASQSSTAAGGGATATAPDVASSSSIPLFVWEAIFRHMCQVGRIEDVEMLFKQLLVLHVQDARKHARGLTNAAKAVELFIRGGQDKSKDGEKQDGSRWEQQTRLLNAAATQFVFFERVVDDHFAMLTLYAKYLHGASLSKSSSRKDEDLSALLGFVMPHHEKALAELVDCCVEAHGNYLTTIVLVEQHASSSSSSSSSATPNTTASAAVPSLDLSLAHDQISEMLANHYEMKRTAELKKLFALTIRCAENDNAKAMLFFEMADRGFLGVSRNERGKSSSSAARDVFNTFFNAVPIYHSLHAKAPEVFDHSALDANMMVPAEVDAELRAEEAAAMKKEHEAYREEQQEKRYTERERAEEAKLREFNAQLDEAEARKDASLLSRRETPISGRKDSRKREDRHGSFSSRRDEHEDVNDRRASVSNSGNRSRNSGDKRRSSSSSQTSSLSSGRYGQSSSARWSDRHRQ